MDVVVRLRQFRLVALVATGIAPHALASKSKCFACAARFESATGFATMFLEMILVSTSIECNIPLD